MTDTSFEHHICYIAVRIAVVLPGQAGVSIGTGFLYKAPLNDAEGRSITLLVSNKHVFANPLGTLQMHINRRTDDGNPDYGNIHVFEQNDFSGFYYPHPENEVDLACVNVSAITHQNVYIKNLHQEFLDEFDASKVLVGSDVIFVGYPENRYDVINNIPIIRKGSVASLPSLDFNNKPQIIIDAQVFQGSSGSPVFSIIDGRYYLLGVVSETMIRHSKLQTLPTNHAQVGVQQILGLGIVIKQSKVKELIEYAVTQFLEREKQLLTTSSN